MGALQHKGIQTGVLANKIDQNPVDGIDYGNKRTGLAVTDPLQIIANGLETVPTHTLVAFLKAYFQKEPVEAIVLGMPKRLDNTDTDTTGIGVNPIPPIPILSALLNTKYT